MALRSDKPWSEGVYVQVGKLGYYLVVDNTQQALSLLQDRWPTQTGERYKSALKLCGTVLKGKAPPDRARESFLEAAAEAEVFTGPVPRHLRLVTPEPGAKRIDMRFYPKKPAWK